MLTWDILKKELESERRRLSEEKREILSQRAELDKELQGFREAGQPRGSEEAYEKWREVAQKRESLESALVENGDQGILVDLILALLQRDTNKFTQLLLSSNFSYLFQNQLVRALEEEKKQLSRELHDGPVQNIAASILRMQLAKKQLAQGKGGEAGDELSVSIQLSQKSVQELRELIFHLRPMALDDLGLFPALKRYVETFQQLSKVPVQLVLDREIALEKKAKENIFRIVQEALTNVRKHAEAGEVFVELKCTGRYLTGVIRDNGKGFNAEEVAKVQDRHFGLLGMQERAKLLGGKLEVVAEEGKGTSVSFLIPVTEES